MRSMQRLSRNEGWDVPSPQLQRNRSFSSDRNSMPASLASPPSVAPDPAYIAAAAASQIITSDHQSQIDDWFDENGGKADSETAVVSPASLTLVNLFLDQLLFSILACARSTAIFALRPAVAEVLRPRLAKDAIDGADEELQEYLGGADDDISVFHDGLESRGKWDLNLAWWRTRLRCMVFTRLGDMEEEDEEVYIDRARLEEAEEDHHRNPRELDIISPAAAIFLTSILEFIGEHALMVAGEAAFNRREIRQLRYENEVPSQAEQVVVEDIDMEKLAFNTTLGRLWRSWKKRVRAPSISHSRPMSRDFMRRRAASLSGSPSVSELGDTNHDIDQMPRSCVAETLREEQEMNLPGASSTDGKLESGTRVIELSQIATSEISCIKERSGIRPRSMLPYPHHLDPEDLRVPKYLMSTRRQRSSSLPNPKLKGYDHSARGEVLRSTERPELALSQHANQLRANGNILSLEDEPSLIIDDHVSADSLHTRRNDNLENQARQLKSTLNPDSVSSSHPNDSNLLVNRADLKAKSMFLNSGNEVGERSLASVSDNKWAEPATKASQESNIPQLENGDPVDYHSPHCSNSKTNSRSEKWETHILPDNLIPRHLASMQGGRIDPAAEPLPEEEGTTHEKRSITALYEVAPIPQREPEATWRANRDVRLSPIKANTPPSGFEHGAAPPLTPLRELVEGAYEPSENSSSILVSQGVSRSEPLFNSPELTQVIEPPIPRSSTFPNFSPTIRSPGGNKTAELHTELPPVNTAGADRAAVQRITPSPVVARDGINPLVRTSTSSNRPLTSASGTSQLSHKIKTLIGRESTEGSRQLPLRRTSSEGSGTASDGQIANAPKVIDRQRSFEQLIKSDETIQFTLTPKSVRDMEGFDSTRSQPGSPRVREIAEASRYGETPELDSNRQTTGRTIVSLKGLNGLRSNSSANQKRQGSVSSQSPLFHPEAVQPQVSSTSLSSRTGPVIPRNARPKVETTSDIAEFIRSTGPQEGPESATYLSPGGLSRPNQSVVIIPHKTQTSDRASPWKSPRKTSKSTPLIIPKALTPSPSTTSTSSSSKKRSSSKLQAREATVTHDERTSDLIDFIRQGPAYDKGDGNHRISRTVAPFRSTMDSDELQALGNEKGKETFDATSSIASTQDSLAPVKSTHSSYNSRTALIDTANNSKARKAQMRVVSKPPRPDEPPHPNRKQRRDRDPYGIDTESDEEDEYTTTPRPERHEEYLIDFLRSITPPPSKPTIPSAFDGMKMPKETAVPRNSNGPNTRERIAPNESTSLLETSTPKQNQQPGAREYRKNDAAQQEATPREISPHPITHIATRLDSYIPTKPTYAAQIDRERKVPRRLRQMPRGERESDAGMSELADFFKNSTPPPPPSPPVVRVMKEESGFSKLFSRKKRKYLDAHGNI